MAICFFFGIHLYPSFWGPWVPLGFWQVRWSILLQPGGRFGWSLWSDPCGLLKKPWCSFPNFPGNFPKNWGIYVSLIFTGGKQTNLYSIDSNAGNLNSSPQLRVRRLNFDHVKTSPFILTKGVKRMAWPHKTWRMRWVCKWIYNVSLDSWDIVTCMWNKFFGQMLKSTVTAKKTTSSSKQKTIFCQG